MEVLFGITGKDFALLAADTNQARSIVVLKRGEDRTVDLNRHTALAYTGDPGDAIHFTEYIAANVRLNEIRHGHEASPNAVAKYTRNALAGYLRTRQAYHINMLIAGVDKTSGAPALYWSDHLANMTALPFAAHGYASYFCMSTMDRLWRPNLTLEEAIIVLQKCVAALKTRFVASLPEFKVKVIDKSGIRVIDVKFEK
ncbi:hypothetical protein CXG81DRAFT_15146 [Caulochytrium protostelioides]|uniref:Proteasome subunit beta n=1 Tax=Caulochytrium protostelioides TaxID=1555241 RepID=A0A4P9WZW9_9FUNG|nr:hypothetical protein CXG81DRAFT_15146 [Caulochytrium protostelioides]|eukprot:RKO99021.1 hypothetical protein CXG81DRAFT_15146 [Caulochytrium protostelioides]